MKYFFVTLLAILIVVGCFALGGLIYWGIGCFACWAFKIDFNWTYWCGLAVQLIVFGIVSIFKK